MPVVVVTDSSSQLDAATRQALGIGCVPLHVLVDGEDLREGVDAMPASLPDRAGVTTAGASPAELSAAYADALEASGGDGVVAVHLSAALSSTYSAALQAARGFGSAVRVVNSRSAAMGVGFVARDAAAVAAAGADLDGTEAAARAAAGRTRGFVVVARLDNLRRSGRVGAAASWLGSALAIKPLLTVDPDGRLVLAQRVRTVGKAVIALVDDVAAAVGDTAATLAVHHVAAPDRAAQVADALSERLPQCASARVDSLGPVLAVHLGAGALAVSVGGAPA